MMIINYNYILNFEKPEKNIDSGIYSAKIKEPVYFYFLNQKF